MRLSIKLGKRHRLLFYWSLGIVVCALCLAALILWKTGVQKESGLAKAEITRVLKRDGEMLAAPFKFEEVAKKSGIDFQHFPAVRRSLLPEDMGSGLAWGDFDNDGDPDLFLVNFMDSISADLDSGKSTQGSHALYRNEGEGRFVNVTKAAGLDSKSFGLAASWADYDNDGDLDLYLSNYGSNILYRNQGDGSFVNVSAEAGIAGEEFSAGSSWADYDNDGWLDLYVSNYVEFKLDNKNKHHESKQYGSEIPFTLNPSSYRAVANRLYHNQGNGTFIDRALEAGVANAEGRSLSSVWFDFDSDQLLDLYVANDVSANGVFHNQGDGTFKDIGASSLTADYRGAMGLAVADIDGDRDMDLFVTHWIAQENGLFENMLSEGLLDVDGKPRLFFMDNAELSGLGQISLKTVGWATGFADFDNNSFLDLWVVNGSTLQETADSQRLKAQAMHIYQQIPDKGFFEVAKKSATILNTPLVGRGGAQADFDGDGRLDIAIQVHGGEPLLLRNTTPGDNHWLGLRLLQDGANHFSIGAKVTVLADGRSQTSQVLAGGSYLSQHHSDLHFGLGKTAQVEELIVQWPDGVVEKQQNIVADQLLVLRHAAKYPVSTPIDIPADIPAEDNPNKNR